MVCLLCCLLLWPVIVTAGDDKPQNTFAMGGCLVGQVLDGGTVLLTAPDLGWTPFTSEIVFSASSRQRRQDNLSARAYDFLASEGSPGGQRGFSARADDDGDGLVDEDPLDGKDNDGDGAIDEDFAAISDVMSVQGRDRGRDAYHLECYKWAYVHLQSAFFMQAGATADCAATTVPSRGVWTLTTDGSDWYETEAFAHRHTTTGRTQFERTAAFVSLIQAPEIAADPADLDADAVTCLGEGRMWLGVVVLNDTGDARAPGHRRLSIETDGRFLRAALDYAGPIPVAVCVADSWARLNHLLIEAQCVYRGVTDPVDKRTARWVVPAICSPCRLAEPPECSVVRTDREAFTLTARLVDALPGLIDPDLLRIGGRPLGAPTAIRWVPEEGAPEMQPWSCMDPTLFHRPHDHLSDPYADIAALREHAITGEIAFDFDLTDRSENHPLLALFDESGAAKNDIWLAGRYLDGRQFHVHLDLATPEPVPEVSLLGTMAYAQEPVADELPADDQAAILKDRNNQPTLSPGLLGNFPNPFSNVTHIRFRVPQSIGEAFVWEDDEVPVGVDLQGTVPWRNGSPRVSVKIYSMKGQELVLLHSAIQEAGEAVVTWSGKDAFGRSVASGTYFCKLQIDEWSVTKRIVYLR